MLPRYQRAETLALAMIIHVTVWIFGGVQLIDQDDDRFGIPKSAFLAAQASHGNAQIVRCGMYVPTRFEVGSMPVEALRSILTEWMWESPSELIPTNEQISEVITILEARQDAVDVAGLVEECLKYIES
jgi:hypothetical protein